MEAGLMMVLGDFLFIVNRVEVRIVCPMFPIKELKVVV